LEERKLEEQRQQKELEMMRLEEQRRLREFEQMKWKGDGGEDD